MHHYNTLILRAGTYLIMFPTTRLDALTTLLTIPFRPVKPVSQAKHRCQHIIITYRILISMYQYQTD